VIAISPSRPQRRELVQPSRGGSVLTTGRVRRSGADARAQLALGRLARADCWGCGAGLQQGACDDCRLCHCPFCGAEASIACPHLLATAGVVRDGEEHRIDGRRDISARYCWNKP
jgi:hypothetical protein